MHTTTAVRRRPTRTCRSITTVQVLLAQQPAGAGQGPAPAMSLLLEVTIKSGRATGSAYAQPARAHAIVGDDKCWRFSTPQQTPAEIECMLLHCMHGSLRFSRFQAGERYHAGRRATPELCGFGRRARRSGREPARVARAALASRAVPASCTLWWARCLASPHRARALHPGGGARSWAASVTHRQGPPGVIGMGLSAEAWPARLDARREVHGAGQPAALSLHPAPRFDRSLVSGVLPCLNDTARRGRLLARGCAGKAKRAGRGAARGSLRGRVHDGATADRTQLAVR